MSLVLKKILLIAFLFASAIDLFAPGNNSLIISGVDPYYPFRKLIHAVGIVETNLDTLSYNPVEKAVGFFQIRPVRIKDYNERTGNNYTLNDMYNYKIAEKVFLYYASEIGPYDFERIAKNWNGSGRMTISYWKRVEKNL